jgi:hypothetical protein
MIQPGERFGKWVVIRYAGNKQYKCRCDCGTERNVLGEMLKYGNSRSCGCLDSSKYEDYLSELFPTTRQREFLLKNGSSYMEIDLFYEEHNVGIEFNGDFWHCDRYKDRLYHFNKTNMANNQNIHLIHIFQYEWLLFWEKIVYVLERYLNKSLIVDVKNCVGKEVGFELSVEFEEKYNLFGSVLADVRLGLFHNEDLVALMSFNEVSTDVYSLERFTMGEYKVVGVEVLFEYFKNLYKPLSVSVKNDRSKFTGETYKGMGFDLVDVSEPDYVIVRHGRDRAELVDFESMREVDVNLAMELGKYLKIYNSGYDNFVWRSDK